MIEEKGKMAFLLGAFSKNPGELLYACENMHETQLNTAH